MTGPVRVLGVVPDLMDRSRLVAGDDLAVRFVASVPALLNALAQADPQPGSGDENEPAPDVVVLDLSRAPVLDGLAAIRAATAARLVGFGSHVDRDTLDEARAAGCDRVLARSAFFAGWPGVLR